MAASRDVSARNGPFPNARDACPVRVTALAAGRAHTCALLVDGSVRCWGANYSGQLGDGTTTFRSAPVAVQQLSGAVAITAGDRHGCAVRRDGTVWCWGANDLGQLGKPNAGARLDAARALSKEYQPRPVAVAGPTRITAIAAGATHSIALTAEGDVYFWGQLGFPLGRPDVREPFRLPVARVTRIVAGADLDCAFADARASCWGPDRRWIMHDKPDTFAISELEDAGTLAPFAIGQGVACGVDRKRSLHCWGERESLGNGEERSDDQPLEQNVKVDGLTDVIQLASRWQTCAVTGGGRVACWGRSMFSLPEGDSDQIQRRPAWVSDASNAVQVVTGESSTCMLARDGTVWCWGENGYGQLGDTTTESHAQLTQVRFCADTSEPVFPTPPEGVALLAALQRTACFGRCPVYSVRIYEDGSVIYRGEWHVRVRGGRKTRLTPGELEALRGVLRKADFLALKYQCRFETTDSPTVRVFFADRGNARLISHYHGCAGDPPVLKTVEDEIDRLVGSTRWVGSVSHGPVDVEAHEGPLTVPGVVEETGERSSH